MTDIWRSFVAQRILWSCDLRVSFHSASVWQERNEHDLLVDFEDENPGYLNNRKIASALEQLTLPEGLQNLPIALRACYDEMIGRGWIAKEEMSLLEAWLTDLDGLKVA